MSGPFFVPQSQSRASLYCLAAGLCDAGTGLALVLMPVVTFEFLGLPPASEPVFVRFLGVFVAQTGLAYLYPWWRQTRLTRAGSVFPILFELTALARLCVASFLGFALFIGWLDWPWLLVLLTDLCLASLQIAWLRSGDLS